MGLLRVRCDQCKGTWEVYGARDFTNDQNRICPHCGNKVDKQTWHGQILPAFGMLMDGNRALMKVRADHGPLFLVDYIEDSYFDPPATTQDVYDRIDQLEDTLAGMVSFGSSDVAELLPLMGETANEQ